MTDGNNLYCREASWIAFTNNSKKTAIASWNFRQIVYGSQGGGVIITPYDIISFKLYT